MSGVQDSLEFDTGRGVRPRGQADTREGPGIFTFDWDATKAAAEDAAADVPGRGYERRQGEIAHAAAEFARQTGKRPDDYYLPLWGEPVDVERHAPACEPKGATYTGLRIVRGENGSWCARCIVDV